MIFPQELEAVDAAFVENALADAFPGTKVTALHHGSVIRGTATKIRLLLDYNDVGHGHGLPPTMWFKGGLEAHSSGEDMMSVYATEAAFYRDIAPTLDLTLPRAFAVEIDAQTGRSWMLLEDMLARNARFGYATRPASAKLAASVLEQLARLHGAHWNDPTLRGHPALGSGGETLSAFLKTYLFHQENWDRCKTLPRGDCLNDELSDLPRMSALVETMLAEDRARANCIVHGDAHLGNVCILPGDAASFLDWQTVMTGFWAHDISYFLTAAMTTEDRRAHERDLIEHYRTTLNSAGGSLTSEEAWHEYRRHALYTYCWFPCNPEWQPEEVSATNTRRAVAALHDLDTLSLWR